MICKPIIVPPRCVTAAAALGIAAAPLALNAADSPKVGFLMSDYTTSARWQFDRDFFIAALKKLDPGVEVVIDDAKTDQTRQQTQAASLLTSGAKLLIDVPVDSTQASAIVRAAHDNNPPVPVIAYDRLINNADVDAYVIVRSDRGRPAAGAIHRRSSSRAGRSSRSPALDGQQCDRIPSRRDAGSRSAGQVRTLKLAYDRFTPNWDSNAAQAETASALNNLGQQNRWCSRCQ